jgi:DNA-binding LytR/AlgR family response regulator
MLKPFFVRNNRVLIRVHPENVICLSTEKNYTKIFLSNNEDYLVRSTLTSALKKLPPDMFIKIHRSIAVSIYHMDKIYSDHLIIGDQSIPVGRQFRRSLLTKLNVIE